MSAVLLMTTSWPIAAIGILPTCVSSTVILGHDADTVAVFRSNCILSSPVSLSVQCCAACASGAAANNAMARRKSGVFMAVAPWGAKKRVRTRLDAVHIHVATKVFVQAPHERIGKYGLFGIVRSTRGRAAPPCGRAGFTARTAHDGE